MEELDFLFLRYLRDHCSGLLDKTHLGANQIQTSNNPGIIGNFIRMRSYSFRDFLKLLSSGAYKGVLFHRVVKDYMIQTCD